MKQVPNIQMIHGDCMDYMAGLKDNAFDLAIVDPPSGIGEDGRKTKGREGYVKQKNGSRIFLPAKSYKAAGWDEAPPDQSYFDELFRVCQRHIIWQENYFDFTQKKSSSGRIVWDKVNGDSDFSDCELAWTNLFSSVRQIEYMWNGFCQGLGIKSGRIQKGNKKTNEKRIHPTQKPVLLYKWMLSKYAKPGQILLDTHGGSGSICIACLELGFDLVWIEEDEDIYNDAVNRFEEHKSKWLEMQKQKTLF